MAAVLPSMAWPDSIHETEDCLESMFSRRIPFLALAIILFLGMGDMVAQAQDAGFREAGSIVGTTGLNIRECPDVACGSIGLAQLQDPVIITGPEEEGFVPVEWAGKPGWAWGLYVSSPSRGTPYLLTGLPGCKRVAILFNIGIGQQMQMHTLRWLKQNDVPATIFPMGWWALQNQDDMREMAMLGFPIGTHGDTRLVLTEHNDTDVLNDLQSSAANIKQVIGSDPVPYFTPYAAAIDDRVRGLVASKGYLPVAWDVSAADWDVDITADFVFERVVSNVVDGSIVEFHLDGPSSAQSTAVAMPWIVENLRSKGFTFVTVQDMAQPCGAATPVATSPGPMAQSATPALAAGTPVAGS